MSGGLNKLATPTFAAGPDDTLVVLDTYDVGDSSVVNSIQTQLNADPASIPFTGPPTEKDMPKLSLDGIVSKPTSLTDKISRWSENNPALQGLFRDFGRAVQSKVAVGGGFEGVLKATLGGQTLRLNSSNYTDIGNVSKVITALGGSYGLNLKDVGGDSSLLTSITRAGTTLGMPNVFSTLAAAKPDKNTLMCTAADLLPETIKGGNIDLLKDMSLTSIVKDIVKIAPNVIGGVISNYKLPSSLGGKDLGTYFGTTKTAFTAIDPGWATAPRAGSTPTINAASMVGNKDFLSLVTAAAMGDRKVIPASVGGVAPTMPVHNEPEKFMMLALGEKKTDVGSMLASLFPTVKVSSKPKLISYNVDDFIPFADQPTEKKAGDYVPFEEGFKRQSSPVTITYTDKEFERKYGVTTIT